ncbi:MAG: chalcone isomerase family protein [Desulfovibrio sp.]
MRKYIRMINTITIVTFIMALLATGAFAATVGGVQIDDFVKVNGKVLQLNGASMRTVMVFDVYAASLYLPGAETNAHDVLENDGIRQMNMHFLRSVSDEKIAKGWTVGFKDNVEMTTKLTEQLEKFNAMLTPVEEGDVLTLTYIPNRGTSVNINEHALGTIKGKQFADALLACWIGPKPGPGNDFKYEILGLGRE